MRCAAMVTGLAAATFKSHSDVALKRRCALITIRISSRSCATLA